jgi:hypothetical protein
MKDRSLDAMSQRRRGLLLGIFMGICIGLSYQLLFGTGEFIFTITVVISTPIILISLYNAEFTGSMITGLGVGLILAVILGAGIFPYYAGL